MKPDPANLLAILLIGLLGNSTGCNVRNPASHESSRKTVYPIKLTRAAKVGDKYHLQAHGSRSLHDTASAQGRSVGRTNLLTIDLDANVDVLEVDATGQEQKLSLTILKCTAATNGLPKPLFTNGSVIIVREHNGKESFEVAGQRLPAKVADALATVITLGGFAGDDDVSFGTTTPKAPGESWPVNSPALLSGLKSSEFEPKDASGQGRLASVTDLDGVPCLDVTVAVTSTNFNVPPKAGLTVREARLDLNFEGFFPTNTDQRLLKETISAKMVVRADQQGPKGAISRDLLFEQSTERQLGR